MTSEKLKKGQLLLAEPSVFGDISFNQSVVLLADHNSKGSVGFILNKPLEVTLEDLVPEVLSNFQIYNGGPVEQDNLYFIHNVPELISNSIEISNGIYWGGDFELTKDLIIHKKIDKTNIRFFLGYSGWEPNQLESELESNSWIITDNESSSDLLKTTSSKLWNKKMKALGGDYLIWYNAPSNPVLN